MKDSDIFAITISPVGFYAHYLICQGKTYDEALAIVKTVSYFDENGLRQFNPECIADLPREAFPPPETLERQ